MQFVVAVAAASIEAFLHERGDFQVDFVVAEATTSSHACGHIVITFFIEVVGAAQ